MAKAHPNQFKLWYTVDRPSDGWKFDKVKKETSGRKAGVVDSILSLAWPGLAWLGTDLGDRGLSVSTCSSSFGQIFGKQPRARVVGVPAFHVPLSPTVTVMGYAACKQFR